MLGRKSWTLQYLTHRKASYLKVGIYSVPGVAFLETEAENTDPSVDLCFPLGWGRCIGGIIKRRNGDDTEPGHLKRLEQNPLE